jgi:hypothetical protein
MLHIFSYHTKHLRTNMTESWYDFLLDTFYQGITEGVCLPARNVHRDCLVKVMGAAFPTVSPLSPFVEHKCFRD